MAIPDFIKELSMNTRNSFLTAFFFMVLVISFTNAFALTPNPLISRNKTVKTSNGAAAAYLNDGKFGTQFWSVNNNSWIAMNTGSGAREVFLNWNDPNYAWASTPIAPDRCSNTGLTHLADYNILTSSNSTDGSDGTWDTVVKIKSNPVTARGHKVSFSGASWIKLHIITGNGNIDEIEVFDISDGAEDTWFFAGTSISANAFKGTPPQNNFADLITKSSPEFTPAMIRGGVGCQNSTDLANNISTYIEIAGNVNFWAIEHGTNDAWNGTNGGVATYKSNMQKVISACKDAGIKPIIARMIATNPAKANWQVHEDYLECIDNLTKDNNLVAGPDLYTYFVNHPDELSSDDGVHPNATGAASIQRLWAEKMADVYKSTKVNALHQGKLSGSINALSINGRTVFHNSEKASATVFSLDGRIVEKHNLSSSAPFSLGIKKDGFYILRIASATGINYLKFFYNR